jgi:hypothetical protein
LVAQYDYDLLIDGRRLGVSETHDDGSTTTRIDWFYDNLGRLTREVCDDAGRHKRLPSADKEPPQRSATASNSRIVPRPLRQLAILRVPTTSVKQAAHTQRAVH